MNVLSIIIPALNEEDGIANIIERILAIKDPLNQVGVSDLELIVVDDGSRDRTPEIIASYPEVVLIQHPVNRGYGAAIKTGFRHARGNLLAFMDADGTYPPEYYPLMCRPILEQDADLVIGSRMAGANSEMPLVRRIGNTIFATLVSIISNRRVTDSASGQRVLRKDVLSHLYPLPDGLNFTPVMSTRAMHEQIKVVEVPIPYKERLGRSKLSVVHDGIRFLNTILMTALTYNPTRIFGLVGIALMSIGTLATLYRTIIRSSASRQDSQLVSWFVGLVLASAGANIFAIGALFNDIVSLFHKRPIRQGLFGRPLFKKPLESRFGWLGSGSILIGSLMYILDVSLRWSKPRSKDVAPWFIPAASTVLVLTGLQLITSWLLKLILGELSHREARADVDLGDLTLMLNETAPNGQLVESLTK
ncbi:MAG TPA: glycosyltransferase family 2 protein [Anaerolineae bacterium]|nr:glycosyltransferase family 2 protein [Anaerolineae bacterium]